MKGILQTKDYNQFIILDDSGNKIHEMEGAALANKCLPGDNVIWDNKCELELRYEHPLIVGTIEFKIKYGFTKKHVPIYLFTPYNKSYPHFIVSCSYPTTNNIIVLVKFDKWEDNFPRGHIDRVLGVSGDFEAEKEALIWQACPYKYPKGIYIPELKNTERKHLTGFTFNIDPEGCKDVDDVLTFEKIEEGWKVAITISDVAAYVENDSIVDIFASLMGQTIYDGVPVRSMLPKEYESTCSLLPGKKSYGLTLQFEWTNEIKNIEWFESCFSTDKSYTYDDFDNEYKPVLNEIALYLESEKQSERNKELDSHGWIEQCMLFYNKEAAKMLKKSGMGILRKHSAPISIEKYPDLAFLGYSSAEYCLPDEDSIHHGLNSVYTHATSPIRRYADLVNQRVLKIILNSEERYIVPLAMYDMNMRAKLSKNYERDLLFLKAIHTKRAFKGIVLDINSKIKLYVPDWKKCISLKYKMIDEKMWSMDEKHEIHFGEVEFTCTFDLNARNWKERIIINIKH